MKRVEVEEYSDELEQYITRFIVYKPKISSKVHFKEDNMNIYLLLHSEGKLYSILRHHNTFYRKSGIYVIYGNLLYPKPKIKNSFARWLYYPE